VGDFKKLGGTNMNILVTGGAGFIGSNFIRYILGTRPACTVINLDKLTYAGNPENLCDVEARWHNDRYFFIKGDIADRKTVQMVFGGEETPRPETVVNFAAESHVDRSILDATPFIETNVKGTQVLLDAAREFGIRRFLQVSTDEVYGSLLLTLGKGFTEKNILRPNSPYSASKAGADLLCLAYVKTFGLNVVISRCCNNYGPFQFPEKLIPLMTLNALEGKPLPIYGDGRNVREWIHVRDHCRAIEFLLDRGEAGEVYNIGTHEEQANSDILKTLLKYVAQFQQADVKELEKLIVHVKDRPGHDRRYALDSTKLRSLGWRPEVELKDGLMETVGWYVTNREWNNRVRSGEYREFCEKWYGKKPEQNSRSFLQIPAEVNA
jgi:dTDP-glucose 4,6-dehydratase